MRHGTGLRDLLRTLQLLLILTSIPAGSPTSSSPASSAQGSSAPVQPSCQQASANFASVCCKSNPPSRPNASRASSIVLSYLIATANDMYGGYRAALRSSTALAGAVYGTYTFNLTEETEILVVDWGSSPHEPLRCTPEYARVLDRVPLLCSGRGNDRTCQRDLVRIIEVPRPMAQRYAPGVSVSEVHAFNLAVRLSRGRMVLRIDQDTLPRGPWFSWLQWHKRNQWPDLDHVWWHHRDSGISKAVLPTVVDDLRYYIHHVEHACAQHQGPVPPRPKYDALSAHGHAADWGGTCSNSAVGVYGYPKVLMEDVRGMNERLIHWGGMEAEMCSRARLSAKFVSWLDVQDETCGPSFSHIEHAYGERKQQGDEPRDLTFANDENWGLHNETGLLEWIY